MMFYAVIAAACVAIVALSYALGNLEADADRRERRANARTRRQWQRYKSKAGQR